ncbi:uncharacterized protein BX664DRAFT_358557 [Halteromyces radiatus]|uniref:uncharacterized protein n=1 Tax=Halteromyces radiatus TaxID=101107 RepID=UPI00221EE9E4|nr:uncharacterized protein BX664DRAFT_358557 [Halteromyces radiatus]KAI8088942.1 hypothetical protein BX664DRAFT_358557 [Halteromyces radiatus]
MALAHRGQRGAPTTIFTTTKLSPRQVATKALTLGCKKLDRDDKRSRPQYNVRERLLLCNTIAHAEEVLNKRTRRTNRRVMAAEDDEEDHQFDTTGTSSQHMEHFKHHQQHQQQQQQHHEEHSPLRSSSLSDDEEEEEEDQLPQQLIVSNSNDSDGYLNSNLLTERDCRRLVKHPMGAPIVAL